MRQVVFEILNLEALIQDIERLRGAFELLLHIRTLLREERCAVVSEFVFQVVNLQTLECNGRLVLPFFIS